MYVEFDQPMTFFPYDQTIEVFAPLLHSALLS